MVLSGPNPNAAAYHGMTATEFLAYIDGLMARSVPEGKHCCKKGCHHCCSEPLYVDEREADLILEHLPAEHRELIEENIAAWLSKAAPFLERSEPPGAWEWREIDNPCPLLIDGLCSVYAHRPMGCRTFFALANPENCAMPMRKEQKFACWSNEQLAMMFLPFIKDEERVCGDHLGVFLAQKVLGLEVRSGARVNELTANMSF